MRGTEHGGRWRLGPPLLLEPNQTKPQRTKPNQTRPNLNLNQSQSQAKPNKKRKADANSALTASSAPHLLDARRIEADTREGCRGHSVFVQRIGVVVVGPVAILKEDVLRPRVESSRYL